ncbi:MAG: ATP-dependent Clp protease proteolytic subunit [Chloroflexi bacterium]|nr:ATP-dependent Clp protease proteolytic subunit [Chloroflexota bacterium]
MGAPPAVPIRRLLWPLLIALVAFGVACGPGDSSEALHVVTIDRQVDAILARYIDRAIEHAEDTDARAVLLRIDTPGGAIDAMRDIVGRIERAEVPVITYVSPLGGQAASAGTFIAMAGHLAAMAPNTTIGAATPISFTGDDLEGDLGRKVTNDTVAFARGVAELRGRNADWAEDAVRDAISATPAQAVELNIVDFVAETEQALLALVEGLEVTLLEGRSVQLRLLAAPRVENDFNAYERVLAIVSDPLIVSLLLLAGLIGIATELFFAPGTFVPGTAGAIALLLAFLGLGTLLPGEAALGLVGLAALMIVLEFVIPTGGVLGAGAGVAFAIALGIWVGSSGTDLGLQRVLLVSFAALAIVTLLIGAFVGVLAVRYNAPGRKPDAPAPSG